MEETNDHLTAATLVHPCQSEMLTKNEKCKKKSITKRSLTIWKSLHSLETINSSDSVATKPHLSLKNKNNIECICSVQKQKMTDKRKRQHGMSLTTGSEGASVEAEPGQCRAACRQQDRAAVLKEGQMAASLPRLPHSSSHSPIGQVVKSRATW